MASVNYYVALEDNYSPNTGLTNTGYEYHGMGGLWNAFHAGDGGATALTAGDYLYMKGDAEESRLVTMTTTSSHATWVPNDAVRNNVGSGDDWTGKIVDSYPTADQDWIVELASGKTISDVNNADGMENTTRSQNDTIVASSDQSLITAAAGDASNGHIHLIGCGADWDPDDADDLTTLNATGKINAFNPGHSYYHIKNVNMSGATSAGLDGSTTCSFWWLENCRFSNNGNDGVVGSDFSSAYYEDCCFIGNTYMGCDDPQQSAFVRCGFINNGEAGLDWNRRNFVKDCIFSGNGLWGIRINSSVHYIVNSVFDSNAADGIYINGVSDISVIVGNCFTHNKGYGIQHSAANNNPFVYENYNKFFGNENGALDNVPEGSYSHSDSGGGEHGARADVTGNGYTKRTHTITYDGGVNMLSVSVNDVITTAAGWGGTVLVAPTAPDTDVAGDFEANITSGYPDNNDAMTFDGTETANVDTVPTIQFTGANATDYTTVEDEPLWDAEEIIPVSTT